MFVFYKTFLKEKEKLKLKVLWKGGPRGLYIATAAGRVERALAGR
jgi:hypothetical protein